MSQKLTHVGLGLNLDNAISILHGTGKPGLSGGLPDEALQGSLYSNDIDGGLWRKRENGIGLSKWSEITAGSTAKSFTNFQSTQIIDYVLVDERNVVKWIVEVSLSANKARRYLAEITALHNGTASADATDSSFTEFSILGLGADIPGLTIATNLAGSGTSQALNLEVSASANIDVISRQITFGENATGSTALDITSVPHDISSTMLGTVAASDPVLFFAPSRAFKIPANFVNSRAVADVAGTDSATVFSIQYGATPAFSFSEVGTVTFIQNSKTGTFAGSGNLQVNPGDIVKVVAPASPSTNLKNICITVQSVYQ